MITIIGGLGFIGSRLASDLRAGGYAVRVVDLSPVADTPATEYRRADVTDTGALRLALDGSEVVCHLAAVHRDDAPPKTYDDINVGGATNVCIACREMDIRKVVFTSSVAVYGLGGADVDEDTPLSPENHYGVSKGRAEEIFCSWQKEKPTERTLVIVRPTVVFGEGNRGNVYNLIHGILSGRFLMVGSGKNRKSMAYVRNLCAFLAHTLRYGPGVHIYNYVDKPDLSMQELVESVLEILGRPTKIRLRVPYMMGYFAGVACDIVSKIIQKNLPISAIRIRKFCTSSTFSSDRLSATGFRPPFSLLVGLARTIAAEVSDRETGADQSSPQTPIG